MHVDVSSVARGHPHHPSKCPVDQQAAVQLAADGSCQAVSRAREWMRSSARAIIDVGCTTDFPQAEEQSVINALVSCTFLCRKCICLRRRSGASSVDLSHGAGSQRRHLWPVYMPAAIREQDVVAAVECL